MSEQSVDQLFDLAMEHHQARRIDQAERIYAQILSRDPDDPDALHLLGVLEFQSNRAEPAIAHIRRAIAVDPSVAEYHFNLGLALQGVDQNQEAIAAFRQALSLRPDFPQVCNALGMMLGKQNDLDESVTHLRRAIELKPDYAEAYTNLGNALNALKEFPAAIESLRKAVELSPHWPEAANNLGIALGDAGKLDESVAELRRAVSLRPKYPEAWNNLAKALQIQGDSEASADAAQKAIELKPDYATAHGTLGNALKDLGQVELAVESYEHCLKLNPDHINAHASLLLALHYHPRQDPGQIFNEHVEFSKRHTPGLYDPKRTFANVADPKRRLRVGYVSPDFCAHSVAFFFENLLQFHDRSHFEAICYADNVHPDLVTDRLRQLARGWHDITYATSEKVAEKIRADGIDILVDLAGHTANNRMFLFARKPAPIQVTYLGYPDTTGLETIDYRFTDALADPPGVSDPFYTEKLIRLPGSFLCYRPTPGGPEVEPAPALNNRFVTFGSFNVFAKVTTLMLERWAQLLHEVSNSRLVLKSYLGISGSQTRKRLADFFAQAGINPNRIEIIGKIPSRLAHMELFNRIDIALDTFPYNGTTTTFDTMWMGVPVVTLAGQTHASRVGLSILTNAGLSDCVAQTPAEYVRIAAELAADLPRLNRIRLSLRQKMGQSPLMNAPAFARNVENEYRKMWRTWCAGRA